MGWDPRLPRRPYSPTPSSPSHRSISIHALTKAVDGSWRFASNGQGMTAALDTAQARRPGEKHRRMNVDFPVWMIAELDREATRLGSHPLSLIKVWIAEKP